MGGLNRYIICFAMCVAHACIWQNASCRDKQEDLNRYLDSLTLSLEGMPDGMDRLLLLDEISMKHYNIDSTLKYGSSMLKLAERLNSGYYEASARIYLGWCYYQANEFEKASNSYYDALHYFDSVSDVYGKAICYYGLGTSKGALGDDTSADEYYVEALALYEEIDDKLKMAEIYRRLALGRSEYHLYEVAKEYVNKAFALDEEIGDTLGLSDDYTTLGEIEYRQYVDINIPYFLFSAKNELLKGNMLAKNSNYAFSIYWSANELMHIYQEIAKIQTGAERNISIDSSRYFYNMNDTAIRLCSVNRLDVYMDLWVANDLSLHGKYNEALQLLKEIETRPKMTGENKMYLYKSMIYAYESSHDYVNALKYTRLISHVDMENYNRDFVVRVTSVEKERELSQLKLRQQKQLYTIVIVSLCFFMVLILAVVILLGFLRNRKLNVRLASQNDEIVKKNAELNERNAEILAQRDEIEVQRDNIEITTLMLMDSIKYAKHIQDAVMISRESMTRLFGDTLIYWKPMNVVSGDFYWAMQKGNLKMLVLADCTGHGVPGAFMSMFAISSLNSVMSPLNFENTKASDVLDMLRGKVIGELHQTSTSGDSIESVDMALCIIDTHKMQMQYAGANRPLLIVRGGNVNVYKPDKMPVGLHVIRKDPFSNNVIDLKKNDVLYMYTDGITDQFGSNGENVSSGKYTSKRLDSLLLNIVDKPFAEQADIIDKTIVDWRTMPDGTLIDQYDDQLLLGVRIC